MRLSELTEHLRDVLTGYVESMLWANSVCGVSDCEDGRVHDCEHTNTAYTRCR